MDGMKRDKGNFWANCIGHCLAHLQNGVDDICEWGFEKMRSVGDMPAPTGKKHENKYVHNVKKLTKGVLFFIGTVGNSFYDKYEELKSEDSK